jgi:hypothetical protein
MTFETFKRNPSAQTPPANLRHCGNCAFAVPTHMQGQIVSVLTCRRMPPGTIGIMDPQGRGYQPITIFPIVTEALHCFEHAYHGELPPHVDSAPMSTSPVPIVEPMCSWCGQLHRYNAIPEGCSRPKDLNPKPANTQAGRSMVDGERVQHTDMPSAYPAVSDEKADDNLLN